MPALALTGTGLFTPEQSISNDELVSSFNEYVRRHNETNADEIASGAVTALAPSSVEFIVKASGIKSRYVLDKAGILDPEVMCPRIPERANDQVSVLAEMAVKASQEALERAGRSAADIDGVLVGASNMQRAYPAMAVEVQDALGIDGFDST